MADEDLREICYVKIDKAIESGADHTSWDTYANVAQQLRDRFIAKKPQKPTSDALEEKKRRKRKVDNLESISEVKDSDRKKPESRVEQGVKG